MKVIIINIIVCKFESLASFVLIYESSLRIMSHCFLTIAGYQPVARPLLLENQGFIQGFLTMVNESCFFLICIVGGGVQTVSTLHVGHSLAYCTCPG
jgi:hypothetical protein